MADLLVLPDDDAFVIARAEGASLKELRREFRDAARAFTPSEELRSLHAVQAHEGQRVTSVRHDVRFYRAGEEGLVPEQTLGLPKLRPYAIAMRGGAVYIGGVGGGEPGKRDPLYVSDREPGRDMRLRPVEVPDSLRWQDRKGIDALVFDGDTLIAVDNVYEPLYFLLYDVKDPFHPKLSRTIDFSHIANGEQTITAALGACFAVLGCASSRSFVHLYERDTFVQFAYVDLGSYDRPEDMYRAMVLSGDRLYLAAGTKGVGVLDVSMAQLAHRHERERRQSWDSWVGPREAKLDYLPAPSGGPVRFITGGRGGLYLCTPGHGGLRSEWLPIA